MAYIVHNQKTDAILGHCKSLASAKERADAAAFDTGENYYVVETETKMVYTTAPAADAAEALKIARAVRRGE